MLVMLPAIATWPVEKLSIALAVESVCALSQDSKIVGSEPIYPYSVVATDRCLKWSLSAGSKPELIV